MVMNVQPIASVSERINEIRGLTATIVNQEILTVENMLWADLHRSDLNDNDKLEAQSLRENVRQKVRQAGLWAPHLPEEYGGAGLNFLELAYMKEVLAYAVGAAALFGVQAPNSGNQSILVRYGTDAQKQACEHRQSFVRIAPLQNWLAPGQRFGSRLGS